MVGPNVQVISLNTSLHRIVLVAIRDRWNRNSSVFLGMRFPGPVDDEAHVDGSRCPWTRLNLTASVHGSNVEECYVPDVGKHVVLR